jgi:hypothetical protein
MSVVASNSVKPSYNDVAHLTLILWAYSLVLLRESWSCIRLCMSRVLSAKLTKKHLSNDILIYSWSTTCTYALFAFDQGNVACCRSFLFGHPALGHLSRHVPRTKNPNYLEMSWHFNPQYQWESLDYFDCLLISCLLPTSLAAIFKPKQGKGKLILLFLYLPEYINARHVIK